MGIDDPVLPAAAYLTGPHADDVLRPVIEGAGGELLSYRCSRVHYRPGRDLVAQFRAEVDWQGRGRRRETIVAATTSKGAPPGSVPVTAELGDDELTVGVWRWPFDPEMPALERMLDATADVLAEAGLVDTGAAVDVDVVTYRPTERAVLRIRAADSTWYLKSVRPRSAPAVINRHRRLHAADLPVPDVLAADPEQGWMLVTELAGPTLRELIKSDADTWIEPAELHGLVRRLAAAGPSDTTSFRRRLVDGPYHAALLSSVLPDGQERMAAISDFLAEASERAKARERGFVHGDLHEAQLVVADGRITGLLDIDEAGMGDPVDDVAVPAAHLRHRALTAANGARIEAFVDEFVGLSAADHDPADITAGTVSVLTGLATSPFRAQRDGWEARVNRVLDLAERLMGR